MPTRNVVLTKPLAALVEDLVAGGRCQTASEALRLIENRESEDALRLMELKTAVQVSLVDSAADGYTNFNSSESLSKHLKSLAPKAIVSALKPHKS